MPITISILISGKVQGVFFRHSTREKATALGISGFVKNQPDDTVFVIATGTKEKLEELVAWCRQGPPKAIVSSVITEPMELQQFDGFSILRS